MVILTFIIAVLNICLGFALATYLGYGPAIGSINGQLSGSPAESLNLEKEDNLPKGTTQEAHGESSAGHVAELSKPVAPEYWDLNDKYVETSILRLNIAMMKCDQREIQIDNQLRRCQGHSDKETVESSVRLLREDCIAYLAEQKEAAHKFQSRINELGELSRMCEEIEIANLEQAAQVESTLNNLEFMDFHTDLETANLRLLEEIKNLSMIRYKLRDDQEAAFLTIARSENRIDKIETRLFLDPLTGLRNRIGLETTLFDWWRQGRHQTRHITAMLFDINGFGGVNHKFGLEIGNRIVYQLAQFLQNSISKTDLVGRYSGQQFLAMVNDVDARTALIKAETWQQSIEKIIFIHEGQPINITVSGAVTVLTPSDTYTAVLGRLENIIKQAKHAGLNRIFFHNGTDTAHFESHKMNLQ